MSAWTYSAVLICPAADQEPSNRLAVALGYGPENFSIPASSDGNLPPTHYFTHTAYEQGFVDMVAALGEGTLPDAPWDAVGLTVPEVAGILGRMIIAIIDGGDAVQNATDVLTENNLMMING